MKTITRTMFTAYIVAMMTYHKRIDATEIIVVLVLFVCGAYNAKFGTNIISIAVMAASAVYLCGINQLYYMAFAIIIFDIMLSGIYYLLILPVISFILVIPPLSADLIRDLLIIITGAVIGFEIYKHEKKEKQLYDLLYDEKSNRYKMESEQSSIAGINWEIQHSTRLRERNRIAGDIHDNVGHKLAGTIIQFRAARKLMEKDPDKTKSMLDDGIEHLSNAMDMLRETVHNLKPVKGVGLNEINDVVNKFKFCEIDLKTTGDFNDEEPFFMSIMARNLKESLTNVARHSDSTKIMVRLETSPKYLRMTVKDNGSIRVENIKEGIGLSGMNERLKNVGGTFSYGFSDGFVQASFIPKELIDR